MKDREFNFYIGGSGAFRDRQKSVFAELDRLESKQPENRYQPENRHEKRPIVVTGKKETRQFRGQESIFKRPDAPMRQPMKIPFVPDFVKNPHKWKKYSLGDDEVTDKTNKTIALAFLEELRKKKSETSEDADLANGDESQQAGCSTKIRFNRHFKDSAVRDTVPVDTNELDKPVFVGSKRVMPEYVVGRDKATGRSKIERSSTSSSSSDASKIKLDHLFDADEED